MPQTLQPSCKSRDFYKMLAENDLEVENWIREIVIRQLISEKKWDCVQIELVVGTWSIFSYFNIDVLISSESNSILL